MNTQHAMLMSLESGRCASRVVVDSDLRIVVVAGGYRVTLPRLSDLREYFLASWGGRAWTLEPKPRGPPNACRLQS